MRRLGVEHLSEAAVGLTAQMDDDRDVVAPLAADLYDARARSGAHAAASRPTPQGRRYRGPTGEVLHLWLVDFTPPRCS